MGIDEARDLVPGDEVYWHDPDGGVCSRVYEIAAIKISGEMVVIHDPQGDTLECFASELSRCK